MDALYLAPQHNLTYAGVEWVRPLPSPWMHLHMAMLAVLGACVAVGYRHRLAAALFTAGFVYTELIEATLYLNHYWFVTLVGALLVMLPVHHLWSCDARSGRVPLSPYVEAWVVWAVRAQVGAVYVFAGLAKLNGDWLARAQPMGLWLADRTHHPVIGGLLDEPLVAYAASWAGALFDCTVVGWLLWKRSRPWAYAVLVGFHAATGLLFQIGLFPWLMTLSALVFFAPDWPSGLRLRLARALARVTNSDRPRAPARPCRTAPASGVRRPVAAVLVMFAVVQVALPLRHYAYEGNVRWTEEGYYWSWRVMLTEKSGHVEFRVTDPAAGRTWVTGPELVLTPWQAEQANVRPDLIHATALLISDHYRGEGIDGVEVRADAWVSINGRPARRMIDPRTDLAALRRTPAPDPWILR